MDSICEIWSSACTINVCSINSLRVFLKHTNLRIVLQSRTRSLCFRFERFGTRNKTWCLMECHISWRYCPDTTRRTHRFICTITSWCPSAISWRPRPFDQCWLWHTCQQLFPLPFSSQSLGLDNWLHWSRDWNNYAVWTFASVWFVLWLWNFASATRVHRPASEKSRACNNNRRVQASKFQFTFHCSPRWSINKRTRSV